MVQNQTKRVVSDLMISKSCGQNPTTVILKGCWSLLMWLCGRSSSVEKPYRFEYFPLLWFQDLPRKDCDEWMWDLKRYHNLLSDLLTE